MKKYLLKISVFIVICFAIVTFVMTQHGGSIDYFYVKFTSPKAKSMIVGDSRSMQGILPNEMNEKFKDQGIALPVFNYSFTIAQAPMGPLYNESIKKKMDVSSRNGVFIISVTPWMFGSDKHNDNDAGEFRETDAPPHNMNFVDVNPNYEYLLKNLNYFHFKALFRKNSVLHKDGWLEQKNLPKTQAVFDEWKKTQESLFHRMIDDYVVSNFRLNSMDELIKELNNYGEVYLVRMPIDKEFLTLEEDFYPEFARDMIKIAEENQIPYFDFNQGEGKNDFKTYDGHHMDKKGGIDFTNRLSDSIIHYTKRKIMK